jgi:Replicative DNA helicase
MIKGIEAEMSVLGCMVLDEDCAKKAVDRLAPEMFFHPGLKEIFEAATNLYWDGKKVEATALMDKLPQHAKTILKLANYVPTWSAFDQYVQIVIDRWRIETIKSALLETLTQADNKTADESVDFLRALIQKQDAIVRFDKGANVPFSDAVQQFTEWLKSSESQNTVKTGFRSLDYAMGGFLRQSVTALCARSGHGKTDFALNLALRMAKKGFKVQYFTLEMTTNQLMQRVASQLAHIDGNLIRDKQLTPEEVSDIDLLLKSFEGSNKVNFVDESKVSTKTIRHYIELFKPDVIFIDHIGLMERQNIKDQYHALGLVSNELKQIAKENNIAVVELVQMNRQIEGRKDKTPNLSDIRESGDIEQDADYAMFVQPEDITDRQLSGDAWADATIYLLKNRHGRPGTFQFHWQPQYHTFLEIENRP